MEFYLWIILIVYALICGFLSADLADKKGYSSGSWFVCGFLFGILGLIAAAGLPQKQVEQKANTFAKKCPDCSEIIINDAKVCKFCRHEFSEEQLVEELIAALESPSIIACSKAVTNLILRKEVSSIPCLLKTFERAGELSIYENDEYYLLQDKIVEGLIHWGDRSITQNAECVVGTVENINSMRKLIFMIGELGDPSGIKILVDLLQDKSLHRSLFTNLIKFGQDAAPHLDDVLNSANSIERKIAAEIVKEING